MIANTLLAKAAAGEGGDVHGLDAAPEMNAVARQKAAQQQRPVVFQTGLIEALPFADGMFDVVLSSLMFHHLPPELKQRGLGEILRVLKPGGRLLIVDMTRPSGLAGRLTMLMLVHHGTLADVHDLQPAMGRIGYTGIRTGRLSWGSLGFIEGQRAR